MSSQSAVTISLLPPPRRADFGEVLVQLRLLAGGALGPGVVLHELLRMEEAAIELP
jgi:hypothetical protein